MGEKKGKIRDLPSLRRDRDEMGEQCPVGKSSAVTEGWAEVEAALARFPLCLHHRTTVTISTGWGGEAAILPGARGGQGQPGKGPC